eukprot:1147430-Pelagomonas_calceolata.AAC.9
MFRGGKGACFDVAQLMPCSQAGQAGQARPHTVAATFSYNEAGLPLLSRPPPKAPTALLGCPDSLRRVPESCQCV